MKRSTLILILLSAAISYSQIDYSSNKIRNQVVTFNCLSSGIIAGIGSMINKPKNVKLHKAFLRGFGYGALGGGIIYLGKRSTTLIHTKNNLGYAWVSKGIFSVGNSIVNNASLHKDILSNFHMNLYFARLEYDREEKFNCKINLTSIYGTSKFVSKYQFNLKNTLIAGVPYFNIKDKGKIIGRACMNSIATYKDEPYIVTHELVHSLQYEQSLPLNNVHYKWTSGNKWLKHIIIPFDDFTPPIVKEIEAQYFHRL